MQTTHSQAKALEYLLKMGWSLQGAIAYVKTQPSFVRMITEKSLQGLRPERKEPHENSQIS